MARAKLTVRPTQDELEQLHQLAGQAGYDSLSAYLIDCGLNVSTVLPGERRTLESLTFHLCLLSGFIEEDNRRKRKKVLEQIPSALLVDIAQRAHEAMRLINEILGQVSLNQESGES